MSSKILIKVSYIVKVTFEYKKKQENLITKFVKDFKVIYTTTKISKYFSNKEKIPQEFKSNIVYEYKCLKHQDIHYIGYTSRLLIEKTNEHFRGNTAISDHIACCVKSKITVHNSKVLKECNNKLQTAINEAILIKKYNPSFNKQLIKADITHNLGIFE